MRFTSLSSSIRSFISFDIDDEKVLDEIVRVQRMLAETGANLKLVEPENIHITMRFLGNISEPMIDLIHREMERIKFTPFEVEVRGVGAFPNLRHIRVVWAGVQKGSVELNRIFNELEPHLRRLGFRPDQKGFTPHITIARVRTGRNRAELARCIGRLANHEFGIITVRCLRLKKSTLTPKGPMYETMREVCR